MKVGGKYRIQEIGRHQWEKAGRELWFEKDYVLDRISSMLSRMPAAASEAVEECRSQGLKARMLSAISSQIKARCAALKKQF